MRVRLFDPLPGDLNYLILKWFTPLDLALARVVCRGWSQAVTPQKLTYQKDYLRTLVEYDRAEYVLAVQRYTVLRNWSAELVNSMFSKLKDTNAIYSLFLWYRLNKSTAIDRRSISVMCKNSPHLWDLILLPILMMDVKQRISLFWDAVYDYNLPLLDWLHTTEFIDISYEYFGDDWLNPNDLYDNSFKSMEYLATTKKMDCSFWKLYTTNIWAYREDDEDRNIDEFVRLVEICGVVPKSACENATTKEHLEFIHICGCEQEISFKRKKVE